MRLKLICVTLLLMLLPAAASAYTLVFRDGRRVVIPDQFAVSSTTLTYEAGTNIQVTVQLVNIDIAATEQANNESRGAFLKRSAATPVEKTATRGLTITNADLESIRKARVASETAYEQRRKELGLPSVEESRRAAVESGERAQQQLLALNSQEQQSEAYWRNRASDLRTQIAVTDERIALLRSNLNELPLNYSFGYSVGNVARGSSYFSIDQLARGAKIDPPFLNRGPQFSARVGFGNGVRGQVYLNSFPRNGFGGRPFLNRAPSGPVVGLPLYNDNSYERAALSSQLNDALAYRAELTLRWRALEEDARRSGAYPGWLR
jgi:hypothetical protein